MRKLILVGMVLSAAPALADPPPAAVRLFKDKCSSCHGPDGKGQTDQGRKLGLADFSSAAWQGAHGDAALTDLLANNKPVKVNGKETAHFSTKLTAEQVSGLVQVLHSFK